MDKAVYKLSEESLDRNFLESRKSWCEIRGSNMLYDVFLQTEDGGSFPAHRVVMSLCSQYFRVLFTTSLDHNKIRSIFLIPGISRNALGEIIEYAYSDRTSITEENVGELLKAADQLNVVGMVKECSDFLMLRLSFTNCISIREFARNYFCFELADAANKFLMQYFVEVSEQSQEYLEMSLEEVSELLSSDYINVRNEELVWEAGLRWIDHSPLDRRRHVHSIMQCVRLGLLDTHYFYKVKQHVYVENNEQCRPIINETLKFLWDLQMIDQKVDEIETPILATPRIPFSILFAIGGWSGGSPTSLIETYDTRADRWIQVADAADPAGPRAYHKLAVIGYDIYVIGGFNGNEYFNSCRCFNAVTKKWRCIAPMHSKRCYVSVATLNNLIYAMGGYDGHHRQNTVERYDYHTNQWSFVTPMNVQRSDASATTLNGLIFIVGGFNGSDCLQSCEFYSPANDIWTNIVSMHHRRSGVSIVSHHGCIYALGGFNGISRLSNCEKYDPESDQWSDVPEMYRPRSNFAIEVMDDLIFAIAGFNGVSTIYHVECYDHRTNEWYEATDINAFRSALAACVVPGLPNINDYIHQNRRGLVEEKRQKLLQQRNVERAHLGLVEQHNTRTPQLDGMVDIPD